MSGKRKKPLYKRFFSRRVKSHGSHRLLAVVPAVIGLVLMSIGFVGAPALATSDDTKPIEAKALIEHECDSSEWHFVITQVDDEANAPASIHVTWQNGASQNVPLDKFTGGVAHYATTSNLDSSVTSATATIYDGWSGQFNLSHGPCGEEPPTVVPVPTQETVDPCNPQGVTNNVTWKDPLPADTPNVDWSESNNGATRTATLIGDNVEWSDGTTAPRVFNLPADSGEKCEEPGDTVPVPNQETVDPCNPEGVTNNVDWKHPLPADTNKIDWSESNNGATRTATLKDSDDKWSDGTKDPKVFNLPADSGEKCEEPPTVVPVPTQETVDPCNPQGVTNNVTWKDPLPADTDTIDWSESNNGATRTATLIGNAEWSDGTTEPKVFNLPADSGVTCTPPEECPDGYQDEDETKPCYVEREPDERVESGTRQGCKLGGVETTTAVFTTTYSFNEETQAWESSETATSSVTFTPYTAAELKEKGCIKSPPPNDNPDHPTNPPHAGATSGSYGLSSYLLFSGGAAFLLAALVLFGVPRRRVGEI